MVNLKRNIFKENKQINRRKFRLNTNFDYEINKTFFRNLNSLSFIELIEMRKNYIKLNYFVR